jgi:pyruvate formate lyase activating enzyme
VVENFFGFIFPDASSITAFMQSCVKAAKNAMSTITVAGLQKTSLIDYPGKVSCVVFITGCNFTCPYCHNPELARGQYPERIDRNDLLAFLDQRRTLLDGVVISGGEPTLRTGLHALCRDLRNLGMAIKLDTNGSRPDVIGTLIRDGLVDYIAMDLKTAPDDYGPPLCNEKTGPSVLRSIETIMTGGVDYEFRTTCAAPFVTQAQMPTMAASIQGARRLALQRFNPQETLDPAFGCTAQTSQSMEWMQSLQQLAAPFVESCFIR